jgi:hypothetical protein
MKASKKSILEGPASPFPTIFTAFVLLLKTGRYNHTIQKSELKTKKQDRMIKESELKTNQHNRPIQKLELKTKKQDRTIKESELKTNRHNRPIQKSELGINRLHRPIQSEDPIGIGRSINRTFRPPLSTGQKIGRVIQKEPSKTLSGLTNPQPNFGQIFPERAKMCLAHQQFCPFTVLFPMVIALNN